MSQNNKYSKSIAIIAAIGFSWSCKQQDMVNECNNWFKYFALFSKMTTHIATCYCIALFYFIYCNLLMPYETHEVSWCRNSFAQAGLWETNNVDHGIWCNQRNDLSGLQSDVQATIAVCRILSILQTAIVGFTKTMGFSVDLVDTIHHSHEERWQQKSTRKQHGEF